MDTPYANKASRTAPTARPTSCPPASGSRATGDQPEFDLPAGYRKRVQPMSLLTAHGKSPPSSKTTEPQSRLAVEGVFQQPAHVRFQGAARSFLLRRCGLRRSLVRTARDRTRRRRLNKLSCAGWVAHDRGSVSGLPRSRVERRSGDRLIPGTRVPHCGPASSNVHLRF